MRFSSVLLYGMSSILFLNCAAKKPIPQVTPEQTQNIQQLEEELKNTNSELSSEDKVSKILLVAELHHRSGNLQSARNWYAQFALDYPNSSEKQVALLGLALIDATVEYPNIGRSNLGKLESIPNQKIPPFTNISRYVILSRYYQGKSIEKMSLYGRQAQGLEKKHSEFSYLLSDLPEVPKRESRANTNNQEIIESEQSESPSMEDSLLMDLEQLSISGDYDTLSRKAASFIIDFPEHPKVGMVRAYEERAKTQDPFDSKKVCVLLPQEGKYGPSSKFFERTLVFANSHILSPVDMFFYDTGIYSYEAQLKDETSKERVARLKEQEKETEEERQLRLDEEKQIRDDAQIQTDADIYGLIGKMVTEEGCAILIGPMLKDTVMSAARAAQDYQVPMLTLSKKQQPVEKGDFVFFSNIPPKNQIGSLVQHAMTVKGWTKFAVLAPDTENGKELSRVFEEMVEEKGGEIVQEGQFYDPAKSSFIPEARKLGQKPEEQTKEELAGFELPPVVEFEALFVPDNYQRTYHVASALAYEGFALGTFKPTRESIPIGMLGLNSWNNPKIIQQYMIGGLFVDGFFVDEEREIIQNFVGSYEAEYGKKPRLYDTWLYDTLQIASYALDFAEKQYNDEKRLGVQKALLELEFDNLIMEGSSFNENRTIDRDLKIIEIDEEGFLLYQEESEDGSEDNSEDSSD